MIIKSNIVIAQLQIIKFQLSKMKLKLITFCVILIFISESLSERKENKFTLNKELERVALKSSWTKDKFYKNLNISCITEKLKLSENGDKEIFKPEAEILMTKAITSCSEYDEIEFWIGWKLKFLKQNLRIYHVQN